MGTLDKERDVLQKEKAEIASLNRQLEAIKRRNKSETVTIRLKGSAQNSRFRDYDVTKVVPTEGTPKSDFHFLDAKGKPILWISHKASNKAYGFQQYGGLSERFEPRQYNNHETRRFGKALKKIYPEELTSTDYKYRPIQDKQVQLRSIYGNDFSAHRKFSENNVQALLMGRTRLTMSKDVHILSADSVYLSGQVPLGDLKPSFYVTRRQDRASFGIKYARAAIYPVGFKKMAAQKI